MSNPRTNYFVNGVDLADIFQPITLGTKAPESTGYGVKGYGDLQNIFAALQDPNNKAITTGFRVINYNGSHGYTDLNSIFAPINSNNS
jgi:hypothetical protein